jgi:uncharacterized membrane protein required for colicin V production
MAFWIGIILSAAFLWSAVKLGFYETWAMFFNMIISTYLAVFLKPTIANTVPSSVETPYGNMLTVLASAAVIFLLLQAVSYTFFTGHFTVTLPKILDVIASGFLGFLAGFFVWSFVTLLISISPIAKDPLVQEIGFNTQLEQTTIPYLCRWCNVVNAIVAVPANKQTTQQAIELLRPQAPVRKAQKPSKTASREPDKPSQQTAPVKESPAGAAQETQPPSQTPPAESSQPKPAPTP